MKQKMKRRALLLMVTMGVALLLGSGVALAVTKQCKTDTTCVGTRKADKLLGTDGNDVLNGRGGDDTLKGFGGDDELIGAKGSDQLFGGPGRDFFLGDDSDRPGRTDTLDGGADGDLYLWGDNWGHDTLIDAEIPEPNPATGNTVQFATFADLTINLNSDSGAVPEVTDTSGTSTVNWDGQAIDNVVDGSGDDTIVGNSAANLIQASQGSSPAPFSGNDTISSGGGDDEISVLDLGGGDFVDCGEGNDRVFYDPGDTLLPNCENQTLAT